jgi:hypothetical protein
MCKEIKTFVLAGRVYKSQTGFGEECDRGQKKKECSEYERCHAKQFYLLSHSCMVRNHQSILGKWKIW